MNRLNIILFVTVLMSISCKGQDSNKVNTISCKYHNVVIKYSGPWTKLPGLDTKEQTLVGVIDYNNGTSYIIKVTKDVSKEEISDQEYFAKTRDLMLKENRNNKLLEEKEIDFHGEKYYQQVFLMYTKRWGLLKHYYLGRRSGDLYYGVQFSFPVIEENATIVVWPKILAVLDKGVLIEGK